jgi:orotidine-5'-phosphate decarboxylase
MATDSTDDQVRIATPASAIAAGADILVIGRPITKARDPLAQIKEIRSSLGESL